MLQGENAGDELGALPLTPDMDINGDGVDDLLIGAANAATDTSSGGFAPYAGKLYVVYGAPQYIRCLPPAWPRY